MSVSSKGTVAGVLASLAELELELGRERGAAAREARSARGQSFGAVVCLVLADDTGTNH